MPRLALIVGLLVLVAPAVRADDTAAWLDAFRQGEFKLGMRYRMEQVDDDAFTRDALASTLRTRLSWRSAGWNRWSLFVEADDVRPIGAEAYNDTRNGRADRPGVADPRGTALNQALLQYTGLRYSLVLGRQRLLLDDQRFVGGSAWRQNEQTFDAVTARARWQRLDLSVSQVANVSRVFGPDAGSPPADLRGSTQLINARLDAGVFGSLVGFVYRLDFDRAPGSSTQTVGLRSQGSHPLAGRVRWLHTASLATQTDAGDNPADLLARYTLFELGLRRDAVSVVVGRERLGGDVARADRSFQTPLGTLHAFQGWADRFGTTPAQGIEDRYLSIAGTWGQSRLQLAWHDFDAAALQRDYGRELDASFALQVSRQYEVMLKLALFRSDGFAADIRKLWLQVNATF